MQVIHPLAGYAPVDIGDFLPLLLIVFAMGKLPVILFGVLPHTAQFTLLLGKALFRAAVKPWVLDMPAVGVIYQVQEV